MSLCSHANYYTTPPKRESSVSLNTLEYWRTKFRDQDFLAIDCIRPQLGGNQTIQKWYRYNIVLYVHEKVVQELSDRLHTSS